MTDLDESTEAELGEKPELDRDGWLSLIRGMGEESGYFKELGTDHWAFFNEDSETLLVSFDRLEDIQAGGLGQMPCCFGLASKYGWSHLSLISEGDTWYRNRDVYAFMDQLVDDAFFDGFDRVVFAGAGMGAYAACAFSVASPGATVFAIQPRASLDPAVAGWDRRDKAQRRLNFNDRYGYAPDMIEGAADAIVIFDPMVDEDAMHAALFRRDYVTELRTPNLGTNIARSLMEMDILPAVLRSAVKGTLTPAHFFSLYRARRENGNYLRRLLHACIRGKHPQREAMICNSVVSRLRAPNFRRHLEKLQAQGVLKKA